MRCAIVLVHGDSNWTKIDKCVYVYPSDVRYSSL